VGAAILRPSGYAAVIAQWNQMDVVEDTAFGARMSEMMAWEVAPPVALLRAAIGHLLWVREYFTDDAAISGMIAGVTQPGSNKNPLDPRN
jgi:hypothetical protein